MSGTAVDRAGEPRLDPWTIAAIAVVAWTVGDMIHEGGGHGGACLLVGGKPLVLTSAYFSYDEATTSRAAMRFVAAGGSVLNLLVGIPLVALARLRLPPSWRLFFWLLAAVNLLTAFGYLLFSSLGGIGDWRVVIDGLPHAGLWRVVEAIAGALLYFYVAPKLLWPGIAPFIGQGSEREARARRLTLLPYLVGGCTSVASGVFNPLGVKIVLISSVAASFGGTSLLAWFFGMWAARQHSGAPPTLGIARNRGWLVAAVIALAIFVGVFGRGVTFHSP
jgi:hypothetical protein